MPGSVEIVSAPAVVRDLEGDERFVLVQFEQHTARCSQCTDALDASHDTLCERGNAYAIDLSKYLYSQGGKYFAVVDRENGKIRRVKLPREAKSALHLLEGIEAGLLLRASRRGRTRAVRPPSRDSTVPVPTDSYDSTYDVRPRLSVREPVERRPRSFSPEEEPASPTIITRKPRSSSGSSSGSTSGKVKNYRIVLHQSPRSSTSRSPASRGSLYGSDQLDRAERRYESTYIKRRSDYHR
ncbi:hypothetical protein N7533_005122 [Penicillium manginii]|uniref:uncharacterized protein n=1 Tax=Penicillium manginii TaxID=203109 RepID=UPI0025485A78|nr:uncharacterized protein N7533_005122 [Penicillium manginii]KAJ5755579.1 hypothetical protein N7533_005122 [Penicillium manginii]